MANYFAFVKKKFCKKWQLSDKKIIPKNKFLSKNNFSIDTHFSRACCFLYCYLKSIFYSKIIDGQNSTVKTLS